MTPNDLCMGNEMKVATWHCCYDDSWNGLIVPGAFSHPAKFAPGLIGRIYEHCLAQGYLKKGDTVVDPFGGIGSGGIFAAPMGLKWVGCELEKKFCDLAWQNFELHKHAWLRMGYPLPVIIKGDSRRLSDIIGQADCAVMSPPYAGAETADANSKRQSKSGYWEKSANKKLTGTYSTADYGQSPGQIGAMKAGSVDAVCTSPPYAESLQSQDHGIDWTKAGPATGNRKRGSGCKHEETLRAQLNYSPDPSNIGNLRAGDVGAVVTSPPWENQEPSHQGSEHLESVNNRSFVGSDYGSSPGQLGQTSGSTYWEACAQVYRECHKILKPGGVLICVVKSYVKSGRRVPLPMQTLKLLIHLGFTPLERIKAMLVKEEVHQGLFGEIHKKKERKSFFRRLAEKKGSPPIDWEEVLICRKVEP